VNTPDKVMPTETHPSDAAPVRRRLWVAAMVSKVVEEFL
jgi:hypothetical protein